MSRKRHTTEQIISKLRQAEVLQSNGQSIVEICRQIGIKEQTYYKWRKEYGGMRINQAKRIDFRLYHTQMAIPFNSSDSIIVKYLGVVWKLKENFIWN